MTTPSPMDVKRTREFFGCRFVDKDVGGVAGWRMEHSDNCYDYSLCTMSPEELSRVVNLAHDFCVRFPVTLCMDGYPLPEVRDDLAIEFARVRAEERERAVRILKNSPSTLSVAGFHRLAAAIRESGKGE